MKVLPFKIPKSESTSLYIQEDCGTALYGKLHQHEEIQISLVIKGSGTFIIGDCVGEFFPNSVFVIGENLPHVFKSDEHEKEVHMITVFFTKSSFGGQFFDLPLFQNVQQLFNDAHLGIRIESDIEEIGAKIIAVNVKDKLGRFIQFLEVLQLLSSSTYKTLSSLINRKKYAGLEGKRMRDIFQHSMTNFHKTIELKEIAAIANMTPNAFCRYFKQRTNKTYVNFLIDIRIGNACKLLRSDNEMSVTEICYKSGFNNLANFNRKFKALKGVTPTEFRKRH
ncbi:MAG: helix-turn-helix domain-containing protein [Flavobacteriaceae bacterium]|nr:helix-turn-helix domain-containing protein [Flavobacteriaceae bacterium]